MDKVSLEDRSQKTEDREKKKAKRKKIVLSSLICLLLSVFWLLPSAFAGELSLHGFLQTDYSLRVSDNNPPDAQKGNLIWGEERVQLKSSFYPSGSRMGFFLKSDFYHDDVEEYFRGELREAYFDLSGDNFALRMGRQIITWGVGDLLFINDVFPKDWQAFYSGRPLQYLKIGVDSLKLDLYSDLVNTELIIIPTFTPDILPSSRRFHVLAPFRNMTIKEPESGLANAEYALRLYRYWGNFDISAYFYRGFFHHPGQENNRDFFYYPKLAVYGLSLQGNALGGVVSAEYGYYDSRDDPEGKIPGIDNSQSKFLIGYQKAFRGDFTVGLQYYGELMYEYRQYEDNLPSTFVKRKQLHQYLTLRLTKLLKYQTLKLSLFSFYSPDEEDFLIMPAVSYNFTDNFQATFGANIFGGRNTNTALGQHDKDDNIHLTLRYSF